MPLVVKPSMFLKLTAQLLEGSEQHSSSECTTGFLVWCWVGMESGVTPCGVCLEAAQDERGASRLISC